MTATNLKRLTPRPSGGVILLILLSWLLVAASSQSPLSPFFFFATALAIDASASAATKSSSSTSSTTTTTSSSSSPILYKSRDYHLLEIVPHSTNSFTQGLTSYNGHLYEGTGLEYKSQILQHDPSQNMKTVQSMMVEPSHLFGEGITHYYVEKKGGSGGEVVREERMIQLTWKNGIGLIYRINNPSPADNADSNNEYPTWELIDKFSFNTHTGEGWGITFIPHANEFYVSDGSEYILVWDVETLQEKRRMAVTLEREGGDSVRLKYLNELEFVDFKKNHGGGRSVKEWGIHDVYLEQCQEGDLVNSGEDDHQTCFSNPESSTTAEECNNNDKGGFTSTMSILANVWYQDVLIRIDPVTAKVTRVYDLSDIYPYEQRQKDGADCLNGISVVTASEEAGGGGGDEEEGLELWVTGKLWPKMYRIRLID